MISIVNAKENTAVRKSIANLLLFFTLITASCYSYATDITPSHVYQLSEKLLADIKLIRATENILDEAKEPSVQINKDPLHVYVKSLEVRTKIIYLQRKYQLEPLPVKEIPLRNLVPKDVLQSISQLLAALEPLKSKLSINQQKNVPLILGKTPADVYENLWRVSYSLDSLVGSISPNLVYRNVLYALDDTQELADTLNVALTSKGEPIHENVKPISPNIEGFKNLYRLARIERKLNLKAVKVRPFPSGEISPSDVYDTTNNILAELVRLKMAQGIKKPHDIVSLPENKKPADVLEKMRLLGAYLEKIARTIK